MTEGSPKIVVRVLGLPRELLARSQEHVDDLRREFALISHNTTTPRPEFPERLLTLFDELEREYAAVGEATEVQLEQAGSSGAGTIDLVLLVPTDAAEACIRLDETLDQADEYCAEGGYLLNLVTPPDLVDFRRSYLGEFVRQISGEESLSWAQWAEERRTG
jgi:hypothetical protein